MDYRIMIFLAGILTGAGLLYFLLWPEVTETETITETVVVDSTYKELYQELQMEVSNREDLSDSLDLYRELYKDELQNVKLVHDTVFQDKPFSAPLRRYNGLEPHLYGNTSYSALVAGNLLDITISNDFKIPEITNTITRTETRTIIQKPKGLYVEGGVSSVFNYKIGATYLNNRSLFGYEYQPDLKIHWIKTGFKVW